MLRELLYRSFLKEDEKVFITIHRHPILYFGRFVKILLIGIGIPTAIAWLFPVTLPFAILWGWIGFLRFLYVLLDWYYDAWLITNVSILQIIWDGFFKKSSTRTEYHYIEGIAYEIKGFWGTLFNYGTIVAEKETGNQIVFENAARPKKKVEQMIAFQDLFVTQKHLRDHKTLKGLMTDMLSHHFQQELLEKKRKP